MTNRLRPRFEALKAQDRAAFVAYVMAGDPDIETSFEIIRGLPAAGADIIEVGFPFSDPMAEGVPIQKASLRALQAGTTLIKVLDLVRRFRGLPSQSSPSGGSTGEAGVGGAAAASGAPSAAPADSRVDSSPNGGAFAEGDQTTPIVLMGYLNVLLNHGLDRFAADARAAGVDGLIVVDCPPEEADPLSDALEREGLSLIRLTAPTTDDERLKTVVKRTSGFVYYVSVAGVTGAKSADAAVVAPAVARIRAASGLPVAVGFGIRTPELAAAIARVADAAVVGSALVDEIAAALDVNANPVSKVMQKATALAEAVHSARSKAEA